MTDRDSRPKQMTLKELMQLVYNAGRDDADERFGGRGWQAWWQKFGKERHDAWMATQTRSCIQVPQRRTE